MVEIILQRCFFWGSTLGRLLLPFSLSLFLSSPQESAAPQTCARLSEPLAAGSSARVFAPWPRFPWRPPPPPSPPSPPAPSTPLLRVLTASSSPASSPPRRRLPGRERSERQPLPLRWAASRSRARVSGGPRGPSCDDINKGGILVGWPGF